MPRNLALTFAIFALSVAIFYQTIFHLDPLRDQKIIAHSALFLSIFCGISSFSTLLLFFGAEIFAARKLGRRDFLIAVRRGILIGIFAVVIAILQLFRLLGLLEAGLLAAFLITCEWICLAPKK